MPARRPPRGFHPGRLHTVFYRGAGIFNLGQLQNIFCLTSEACQPALVKINLVCNGPSVTLGCRGVGGEAHSRHCVPALRHMAPSEVSTITKRHGRCGVHGSGIFLHSPSNHSRDRYHPVTSAPACLRASATTSCDRGQLHSVAPHAWLVASPHRDARAFTCHLCSSTPLQARWRPVNHALFVSF